MLGLKNDVTKVIFGKLLLADLPLLLFIGDLHR